MERCHQLVESHAPAFPGGDDNGGVDHRVSGQPLHDFPRERFPVHPAAGLRLEDLHDLSHVGTARGSGFCDCGLHHRGDLLGRERGRQVAFENRDLGFLLVRKVGPAGLLELLDRVLALLDLLGREHGQSVEALLALPELHGSFRYSAVLGVSKPETFAQQFARYVQLGFRDFKVKVGGDLAQDRANIALFKTLPSQVSVRLDANNLWQHAQQGIDYINALDFPFAAIEEALQVRDYQGYRDMFEALGMPIIVDESFTCARQFADLKASPQSWIINLRVSKMGGMLRSLSIAEQARAFAIPIIIGAQVGETSILTRAALTVANAHRDILLAQEGAFGTHLLQNDLTDSPLMFGAQGILEIDAGLLKENGFGLRVTEQGVIKP